MTRTPSKAARTGGYTMIEVLVTMGVIGVLFTIAYPLYFSQRDTGYIASAQSDSRQIGLDLNTELIGYRSFGDDNGAITLNSEGHLEFSPMTGADPYEYGPQATSLVIAVSPGSTFTGGTYGGGTTRHWCVSVTNHGKVGVFTDQGMNIDAVACASDGTAQMGN
jgi:prepilin-type N-terminal cleavage/methylation domain-containing protein